MDKDTEIGKLRREIQELKEKVQRFESDKNIFKKHKKRFSVNLLTLILKLVKKAQSLKLSTPATVIQDLKGK